MTARPIRQLPFLAWGVGLFALKIGADYGVSRLFGRAYSVLFYVSPLDAPLLRPGDQLGYWLTLWGVALPFIAVGLWLTVRRLRDANAPPWLSFLFFVPFANLLFFVACVLLPSRGLPVPGPTYREPPPAQPPERRLFTSVVLAGAAGAVLALGSTGISVGLLGEYGAALFLGAPALSGFVAALVLCRLHGPHAGGIVLSTLIALTVSFAVMLVFAMEGAICLLMAAPLAAVTAAAGAAVGYAVGRATEAGRRPGPAPALALVPLVFLAEALSPLPARPPRVVTSEVVVDAPPEIVWRHVIAFPELPPPDDVWFRLGVAAPMGAVIEGEGVGAIRRCRFTTGEFVEPIEAWRPPRELRFGVLRQPDPMSELSPWDIRPRHLAGSFRTIRGQFLLDALPDGRTRVRGRTWYVLDMAPRDYWELWADSMIHRIHLRVLRHVERLAEADAAVR